MLHRRTLILAGLTLATATFAAAQALQVEAATQPDLSGDISPMMAAFILLAAVAGLVVLVVGIILGILAAIAGAVLLAVGMVSLSTLVAIARKSIGAGMQALLFQLFAVGGVLVGASTGIIGHRLQNGRWSGGIWAIVLGGAVGIAAALAVCWVFLTAIRMLIRTVCPEKQAAGVPGCKPAA